MNYFKKSSKLRDPGLCQTCFRISRKLRIKLSLSPCSAFGWWPPPEGQSHGSSNQHWAPHPPTSAQLLTRLHGDSTTIQWQGMTKPEFLVFDLLFFLISIKRSNDPFLGPRIQLEAVDCLLRYRYETTAGSEARDGSKRMDKVELELCTVGQMLLIICRILSGSVHWKIFGLR